MTRGRLVLITDDAIYSSVEFNGDMYWEGHGKDAYEGMEKVKNIKDYESFVEQFDKQKFGYAKEDGCDLIRVIAGSDEKKKEYLNFKDEYLAKWFSDYLYIKNVGTRKAHIQTEAGDCYVYPGDTQFYRFGKYCVKPLDIV